MVLHLLFLSEISPILSYKKETKGNAVDGAGFHLNFEAVSQE